MFAAGAAYFHHSGTIRPQVKPAALQWMVKLEGLETPLALETVMARGLM